MILVIRGLQSIGSGCPWCNASNPRIIIPIRSDPIHEQPYPLLSMKKDQANKTNVERVYRQQPLVWEPGPNRSSIDLWLVQEWAQHSCISCTSMLWSWSGVEVDGVGGSQGWAEKGKGGHTMTLCVSILPKWLAWA